MNISNNQHLVVLRDLHYHLVSKMECDVDLYYQNILRIFFRIYTENNELLLNYLNKKLPDFDNEPLYIRKTARSKQRTNFKLYKYNVAKIYQTEIISAYLKKMKVKTNASNALRMVAEEIIYLDLSDNLIEHNSELINSLKYCENKYIIDEYLKDYNNRIINVIKNYKN